MKKLIIISAIVFLAVANLTSMLGWQNGIDALISNSEILNYIRFGAIGILVVLMLTKIPRSVATRAFVGVGAVLLFVTNIVLLNNYHVSLLDFMVFALVSVIFAIEAAEFEVMSLAEDFQAQEA